MGKVLDEFKQKFNEDDKPTFAASIWVCVMLFIFLVMTY